ncbi:MAG: amidase [Anaerolineae bacterium]|nr:amidase [Anaerolineae bacterium]
MDTSSIYDLKSISLPRLAGGALRLVASLLEAPLTRPLLEGSFLGNAGLPKIRAYAGEEAPTYLPLYPAPDKNGASAPDLASIPEAVSSSGFRFRTVRDYAEAYRSGVTTPLEVAERALEATEQSDQLSPAMRIFIAVNREDVLAQARTATERIRAGQAVSIFDGVPVAVKDEVDMTPYPTTVGTKFMGKHPAAQDSTVVARMRAAGALLLGKANMHEIGIDTTGRNPHYGTPRNPYNTGHYTGGSSSGPGAAVGAGLCPVAIGADGGGSIRIPSAFCGVVGLKPTFGRVSEFGAAPLTWSMGHLGPIAATVQDAALGYAVLAGADPLDPNTHGQPAPILDGYHADDLKGLTLGVFRPWFEHATPEIVAACQSVLDGLAARGATVHEIAIPELDIARIGQVVTILSEMMTGMGPYYAEHRHDFDLHTRLLLALAGSFTAQDYVATQRIRTRTIRTFMRILSDVDVIITPTTAVTAPAIPPDALPDGESDTSVTTEIMRFVNTGNFTGLPALTFPAGYDSKGLPIGCQVMGRPWEEHTLLRIAHVAGGFIERRAPQVHYDLLQQ